ncbi:MAG: acyl--CoA ligase, partial [Actinomycetota bacterium]|nr:acyl--CoA ligase [Actinomycetota bacterium]
MTPGDLVAEHWLGTEVRCYPGRIRTIVEALDRAVESFPERTALETPEGDVTYRELAELVEGATERLADEGLVAGDRLAVCLRNGLDIVVAIWACARARLVFVGLSTRLQSPQWAFMLRHSGSQLALAHPELLDGLRTAGAEAGLPEGAIRDVGDHLTGRRSSWRGAEVPFPDQDETYGVIYTSGTTGQPKASQVAHRCTMHSAIAYVRTFS